MKNKIISILLVSMLTLSMVACSDSASETIIADFTPSDVISTILAEQNEDDVIPQLELDALMLEESYGITEDMYVSFQGRIPMMTAHCDEYIIIEATDGQVDAIKEAFMLRQEYLANPANMGYPEHIEFAENYVLESTGNMIVFAIGMSANAVLDAFNAQ